jgi:type II secretory pathway component HofQ
VATLTALLALPVFAATEKKMDKPVRKNAGAPQRTVTLDVKDAEVRDILKTMQKQCGIKNVVVDPEVQVKGTFYFERLPCRTAFSVVFRTLGLDATNYPNSVITAGPRR